MGGAVGRGRWAARWGGWLAGVGGPGSLPSPSQQMCVRVSVHVPLGSPNARFSEQLEAEHAACLVRSVSRFRSQMCVGHLLFGWLGVGPGWVSSRFDSPK